MWICSFGIFLFFLIKSAVVSTHECETWGPSYISYWHLHISCRCIHYSEEDVLQYDEWGDRIRKPSRTYAKCYSFVNDSNSPIDSCPEDVCEYIIFFFSEISTIPINFFKATPHVKEIYLNSSSVKELQIGAFAGSSRLHTLQLNDNELKKIKLGVFNNLETLETLDLHNNRLETMESDAFLGLSSLIHLDLSKNQSRSIPYNNLNHSKNVQTLILSHNHLSVLNFNLSVLKNLETLYLNDNNIADIEECFKGNTNLRRLDMQNNAISHINDSCFEILNHLGTRLDMNNNNISRLNFIGNVNLKTITISGNALRKIPLDTFENQKSLENLDLSKNKIDYLGIGTFSGAPNIKHLNLSNNQFEKIGTYVLVPLKNLLSLDISYNHSTYFDLQCFSYFDNFQTLYVQGNNFSCEVVSSIFKESRSKNFSLSYESNYSVENIIGLPCNNFVKQYNLPFSNISNIPPSVKNMDEKYGDSLYQSKRWIIIGFSIFPCIYVTVKLLSCFISRRKTEGLESGQEMPILS